MATNRKSIVNRKLDDVRLNDFYHFRDVPIDYVKNADKIMRKFVTQEVLNIPLGGELSDETWSVLKRNALVKSRVKYLAEMLYKSYSEGFENGVKSRDTFRKKRVVKSKTLRGTTR